MSAELDGINPRWAMRLKLLPLQKERKRVVLPATEKEPLLYAAIAFNNGKMVWAFEKLFG